MTEDVEKDRRYSIDAAIVRTMKSRKQSTHQALVIEVSRNQLQLACGHVMPASLWQGLYPKPLATLGGKGDRCPACQS